MEDVISPLDERPIGIVGLSHLGVVTAASLAVKGMRVVAFDQRPDVVADAASGALTFNEPQLAEALLAHRDSLHFSGDPEGLRACSLVYVALDVPTDGNGSSDLASISSLIAEVAQHRSEDSIIVVLSQVPPGFTGGEHPIPPEFLYYQVETLVFGDALARALHPERFILGCAAPWRPLPAALSAVLALFGCPVFRMGYESAELAKIAINVLLVSSLSTAAMLSEICEPAGANWTDIVPALRADRRIGPHAYLQPGLGLGGGNLERDLATVTSLSAKYGVDTALVGVWGEQSLRRRRMLGARLRELSAALGRDTRLAIWGLSYKENTASTRNSPAIALIRELPATLAIAVHDPVVDGRTAVERPVTIAASPLDAATEADILAIMTPWPEYKGISAVDILSRMRGAVVFDPFGVIDPWPAHGWSFRYHRLGQAPLIREVESDE